MITINGGSNLEVDLGEKFHNFSMKIFHFFLKLFSRFRKQKTKKEEILNFHWIFLICAVVLEVEVTPAEMIKVSLGQFQEFTWKQRQKCNFFFSLSYCNGSMKVIRFCQQRFSGSAGEEAVGPFGMGSDPVCQQSCCKQEPPLFKAACASKNSNHFLGFLQATPGIPSMMSSATTSFRPRVSSPPKSFVGYQKVLLLENGALTLGAFHKHFLLQPPS